jgi:broad specificity phosphatase PhoE
MIEDLDKTIACLIARHGQTVLNAEKCFRGRMDVPLDVTGIKQAHKLSELLRPIELGPIFCSDTKRATKTAEIIAEKQDTHVCKSPNLRALNVGVFSGQKRSPENLAALTKILANPETTIPEGESLNDFSARVRPCIHEAIEIFMETGIPPLLVGHSSIIREVGAMFMGDSTVALVEPGGVLAIYFDEGKLKAKPIYREVEKVSPGAENFS